MQRLAWIVCLLALLMAAPMAVANDEAPEADKWAPVRPLVGAWKGHGDGSTVTHSYHFVLQDQFIHSRTRSEFEPKEGEDAGEIHEDLGFFSYDPVRQAIIFRQFLSEGFVNTYVLEPRESDEDPLVFMSESCEGAGNMRARLTIDLDGDDRYTMVLELASPGKKFFACQNLEMKRAQ
ncbi:MAG: hypothetical protein KAJ97_04435 [Acidobacteria bacterium]|nr:hypothetical protein [Acidobacteriota bacterium]